MHFVLNINDRMKLKISYSIYSKIKDFSLFESISIWFEYEISATILSLILEVLQIELYFFDICLIKNLKQLLTSSNLKTDIFFNYKINYSRNFLHEYNLYRFVKFNFKIIFYFFNHVRNKIVFVDFSINIKNS